MSIALHTDLYQLNMGLAYFNDNTHERKAVFEVYYRDNPFNNGHGIFAGLEKIIEIIQNFKFTDEDIAYLKSELDYPNAYLDYLSTLHFTGTIHCVREGEVVFANTPLLVIEADLIQAQLLETIILNIINYQTLIATKASKIRSVASDDLIFEFGTRRAHETEAALWGTRAAYIGGFDGTSLVSAGQRFGLPIVGTHAHSFVQSYNDEYEAFTKYAQTHKNCTFLIDTYDTLNSGIVNAIKVANEFKDKINFNAVRLDSGDLAYLSKEVRKKLDAAGYRDTKIIASNDLDEQTILSLKQEGAMIDSWGIGTKLITAFDQPALGAVYKLVAIENKDGQMIDVIKISSNVAKITTPGKKAAYRILSPQTNKAVADYISLWDENLAELGSILLFNEQLPALNTLLADFKYRKLHHLIFENGKLCYQLPTLIETKDYAQTCLAEFWPENLRYKNPSNYYVDLSPRCYENKINEINRKRGQNANKNR
ncbi:MAG: nicotinate phosphoribosyltransferase [Mycoplasmatales bacterium]